MSEEEKAEPTENLDTTAEAPVKEGSRESGDAQQGAAADENAQTEEDTAVVIDGTKRILVVEDTGALRRIIVKYLKQADYDTLEAEDGKEALKILIKSKAHIDMVLLDIMMPVMDGITFLKKMRSSANFEKKPVVMLTSKSERSVVLNAVRAGANDFIIKPFTYDIIIDKVQKTIGQSAPARFKAGFRHSVAKIDYGSSKTPNEKIAILIKRVRTLLALPFSVVQISQLCGQEDTSAADLVKPIQSDPAVAAVVLTRANSAAFGGSRSIHDLKEAVVRIGMKETRNIAVTFSVMKLFSKDDAGRGFSKANFWLHSLSTGICAQLLAKHLGMNNCEDAFLAGLLHDIGKMVLDDFLPEEYSRVIQRQKRTQSLMREAEASVFEVGHAYVGGMIADSWGFPKIIAEAILNHHKNERFKLICEPAPIEFVVNMADQIAKALQLGSGGDAKVEVTALPLWLKLAEKPLNVKTFLGELIQQIAGFMSMLKIEEKYIDLTLPEEERGTLVWADIDGASEPSGYEVLLELFSARYGFALKRCTEIAEVVAEGKQARAVIANMTRVQPQSVEEVELQLKNSCDKLVLIDPNVAEDDTSRLGLPLDFDDLVTEVAL